LKILNYFQRKTSSNKLIPEIDGLRFLAIITVVFYHLNTVFSSEMGLELSNALIEMGGAKTNFSMAWWWVRLDLGVKVFFAISGFVLALPFLKYYLGLTDKKVQLRSYFIRRLTRLEPPFIITLVFFYFVHVILLDANSFEYLKHLGVGLIYGHVFIYGEANPINPVSWSLETEAQFYVLVPLLFWLLFRFSRRWLPFIILLGLIGLSAWFKQEFIWSMFINRSILAYFMNFGMGILACWLYLKFPDWFKSKHYGYDLLGLLTTIGLFYFYKPQHDYLNIAGFNIALLGVITTAFKGRVFNWFYTRNLVFTIGGMCYSIYLLHYAFLHLSVKYTSVLANPKWGYGSNLFIQILINIPLVMFVSGLFFVWFERPFMDKAWMKRIPFRIKK
jgi:peptidoglycan/LPS O-acetylase OafA/YrhL